MQFWQQKSGGTNHRWTQMDTDQSGEGRMRYDLGVRMGRFIVFLVLAVAGNAFAQPKRPGGPIRVAEGFAFTEIARGLTAATAMEVTPDGRVLVCEQTGTLRMIEKDRLVERPMLAVKVDATWERGLIGVTVGPEFPRDGLLYVAYVSPTPW